MAQIPQKSNTLADIIPYPEPENELDVRIVRITESEGIIENIVEVGVDYDVRENDRYIMVNAAITIYLPVVNKGKALTIKSKVAGTVTINGNGNDIDGSATQTLTVNNEYMNLFYDGIEWSIN